MFLFRRHKLNSNPLKSIAECKQEIEYSKNNDVNVCRYEIRMIGADKFQVFRCYPCRNDNRVPTYNFGTIKECIDTAEAIGDALGGEFYIEV